MDKQKRIKLLSSLNPKHFELILFPTEQCNFRCVYCYEDFEIGRMKDEVIRGVKKLIEINSEVIEKLHLSWFGGEPLLGINTILDISNYANTLALKKSIKIEGSMTTNAYLLTPEMMGKLTAQNINSFQISLDGYGDVHDKTRKLANGGKSFDTIWKNLHDLCDSEHDFKILLRIHLTPENIVSVYELASKLKKTLLRDRRFEYTIKPVGDWGGPNTNNIRELSREMASAHEQQLRELIDGPSDEVVYVDRSAEEKNIYICYASKSNSYVIRANGKVQKCTVALDADHNTVGNLDEDGSLNLNGHKIKDWMRGFLDGDEDVLGCPAWTHPSKNQTVQVLTLK